MTDADRLAVVEEILALPRNFRDDLTVVYDYRDEVLGRLRQRDTVPAPFEDEPPTRIEGRRTPFGEATELAAQRANGTRPGARG